MGLNTNILIDAMLKNIPNPSDQQKAEINDFAVAIKQFVESADVMYVTSTLNSPSGAVTDAGTSIAKLQ